MPPSATSTSTRACEGDAELREEVQSLIDAYEEDGDTLEPSRPERPADPLIGTTVGTYRIVEHIGSGGMGSVYRAERADEVFQKEVAIKVVRRGLDLDYMVRHFRLRAADHGQPGASQYRAAARRRRDARRRAVLRDGVHPRQDARRLLRGAAPGHRASGWSCSARSAPRWISRTGSAWCIAISSLAISW